MMGPSHQSIGPTTTDPGCTTEPTLFRGIETPSLTHTPWPNTPGCLERELVFGDTNEDEWLYGAPFSKGNREGSEVGDLWNLGASRVLCRAHTGHECVPTPGRDWACPSRFSTARENVKNVG